MEKEGNEKLGKYLIRMIYFILSISLLVKSSILVLTSTILFRAVGKVQRLEFRVVSSHRL